MRDGKLDVSAWNLAVPMVLLAACGPVVPIDGTGSETESDTIDSDTHTTTIGSATTVGPSECSVDADCDDRGFGWYCVEGQCVYEYTCDDCCDGECGWYGECYIDEECDAGEVCRYNYCEPAPAPVECEGYALVPAIPEMPGDAPILALAFVEALPSAGRELAVVTYMGVTVVASDGTTVALSDEADASQIAAADLDNDGDDDLVLLVGGATPSVRTLLSDGMGAFVDGATMASVATRIALGDFDADGFIDLATGSASGADFVHGNGDGTFGSGYPLDGDDPTIALAPVPAGVGTDLIFYSGGTLWWANAAAGLSAQPLSPAVSFVTAGHLTVGDYDGNGFPDASVLDDASGSAVVQTWHDLVALQDATPWTPPADYSDVASGDVDGDGRDDLVLLAQNGELAVRRGSDASDPGCYVLGLTHDFAMNLTVDDFDGDGRDDIIATAADTLLWVRLQ